MELVTEYLIFIEKKSAEAFFRLCDDITSFKKFLQTEKNIIINNENIIFESKYTFKYYIKTGEVKDKSQRFFHLKLVSQDDSEIYLDKFTSLNKTIRGLVHDSKGKPETLWNDISFYYSQKAYPLIHNLENLMRKLITYFMLTNVGKEWVEEASPKAIIEAIDKSKRKEYLNVLHKVDFKHLSDFLFKVYEDKNFSDLLRVAESKIKNKNESDTITYKELIAYKGSSNWDRYFSHIVNCDGDFLNKIWNDLYDLRCKVAHNAIIGKADFDRIVELKDKISNYLQSAIDNLDKIHIPDNDKEHVAENVISNLNETFGEFIILWKKLESLLNEVATDLDYEDNKKGLSVLALIKDLYGNNQIQESVFNDLLEISKFRNFFVHGSSVDTTEQEVAEYLIKLKNIISVLKPVSSRDEAVEKIEGKLNIKFEKIKNSKYKSTDGKFALSCSVSKKYDDRNDMKYWFAFHPHQKDFVENAEEGYVSFRCGSVETIVMIPIEIFSNFLTKLYVTESKNRFYWHVQMMEKDNELFLIQKSGENVSLTKYII